MRPCGAVGARSARPRVKEQSPCGLEIGGVPGHDAETVAQRSGGDECVGGVDGSACFLGGRCEFSPDAAGFEIDREEPIGVGTLEGLQPGFKRALPLAFAQKGDPLGDFADSDLSLSIGGRLIVQGVETGGRSCEASDAVA